MTYGEIMEEARLTAGISREKVADLMNTTYKTVWSWENGFSEPKITQFFEFFNKIGVNVKPYINKLNNCDDYEPYNIVSEKQITIELHQEIDSYSFRRKSLLHFVLCHKHGADIDAELNKEVAHLQTNLTGRVMNTVTELTNYRLNKCPKNYPIKPNTELVHTASLEASKAIIAGRDGYIIERVYKDDDGNEATIGMLDI